MQRRTKLMLAVIAIFGVFMTAPSHAAEPSSACGNLGGAPAGAVQTSDGAIVCVQSPAVSGNVQLDGPDQSNPTDTEGHVVVDGDSTNPGPLSGYAGVESGNPNDANGGIAVVGCSSGDFNEGGTNHVIVGLDPNNPQPPTPPNPSDPCFPSAP
ncbi:MAG: hypothetical protein ACYDCC_08770 [Actinomycetota bacterium]